MIEIRFYSAQDKAIWNLFNKNAKNGLFMFDRDYMDYHSDRFEDCSLMFYQGNRLLALLPLNRKGDVIYSHQGLTFGGFIISDSMKQSQMLECFRVLRSFMQRMQIKKMIYKAIPYIYHQTPAQEDLYALFVSGATLWRMDCSSTIHLQKPFRMNQLRRRGVNKAKREGVSIAQSEDFRGFIALLNGVLQSRHNVKAVHNAQELALLYARFTENIKLFVALKHQEILAGVLLFVYPHLVHTQYLAVSDKGREIGALDLLLKTLIDKYATSKQYFDFGISNEQNGLFLNEGLIAQKEGFGGRVVTHSFYELSAGGGGILALFCFLIYTLLLRDSCSLHLLKNFIPNILFGKRTQNRVGA